MNQAISYWYLSIRVTGEMSTWVISLECFTEMHPYFILFFKQKFMQKPHPLGDPTECLEPCRTHLFF